MEAEGVVWCGWRVMVDESGLAYATQGSVERRF